MSSWLWGQVDKSYADTNIFIGFKSRPELKISARADLGGMKPAHDRCLRNNADSARPDPLEKSKVVMAHPDTVVGSETRSIFHAEAYVKQFNF